ncbi:MAG: TolC family protein [Thermodesulfobacteriota bacterium]
MGYGSHKSSGFPSACLMAALLFLLGGCRLSPPYLKWSTDPLQSGISTAHDYILKYRKKPVTAEVGRNLLTIEDCRNLALVNNLDLQVELIDEAVKKALKQSQRVKTLPHMVFSGELSERDNQRWSYSEVLGQEGITASPGEKGTGVTNFSNSHERSTWRYSMETRWSPTEAALAYYLFDSSSNDRLKAHFQSLRVGQRLVGGVEAAFYRLLGLTENLPLAERLYGLRASVSTKAGQLLKDKLLEREDYYRAKQNLLKAERLRTKIRIDIRKQRNVLGSAMGLSPDLCLDGGFGLVGSLCAPSPPAEVCELELQAVNSRPEAYMAGLAYVNSVNDLRRTIVKYFPTVTGFWRYTRDKDKFVYEKEWKDVGVMVYFDLLDWLANTRDSKATKANSLKTHRQIGSIALGIVSEVRVTALDYLDSLDALANKERALQEAEKMRAVIAGRASLEEVHKVALQEAEGDVLQERIGKIEALADANAAFAKLRTALGTNYTKPMPKKEWSVW